MNETLISPCGMNCAVCGGYLALKHDIKGKGIKMPYCAGCRVRNKKCAFLKKKCHILMNGNIKYCYECGDFPCRRLEAIDKRYRSFFRMSLIENLETIRNSGIGQLLEDQERKWRCSKCGGVISCHNGICFDCGIEILRNKRNLCRWED